MGNPKQKWTPEEEEALRAGIAKYGTGKWKNIKLDSEFNQYLHSRTNIDLKDKWRNISAAAGQGSRTLKARSSQDSVVTPVLNGQTSVPALPVVHHSPSLVKDDASKELPDAKNGSRYNAMVIEALSTAKESNGLDISSLVSFIEQRVEVPLNFRKLLGSRLRRLVAREKLEKIDNCYRIKDKCLSEPHQTMLEDIRPRQSQSIINSPRESLEAVAAFAAMSLAKAEDLSFQAAEAVRETERVTKMAEEAVQALQLANEIFERCSRGEVVPIA